MNGAHARNSVLLIKPQFAWFEVRLARNQDAKMADIENVNDYPAPAWKVRVPNWPYKTGPLIDAAPPSGLERPNFACLLGGFGHLATRWRVIRISNAF